jgi:MoaD family protein
VQVKVLFFTRLREIVGKKEETLSLPDDGTATVEAALKVLTEKYGSPFIDYVYDPKTTQPKGFLQFLINGSSTQNGLQTPLGEGDVLAILPPVGGG